ncbi:MAG TPA: hypothetical protein VHE12_10535 [bacterium]|nr:hypothetical protein [bacterium]
MRPLRYLILFWVGLSWNLLGATPEMSPSPTVGLSAAQWEEAFARFETSFALQTARLNDLRKGMDKGQSTTQELNAQVDHIRNGKEPGVFDQARLNHLLNELKDQLERNAALQRQWTDVQKDQEQKGLSLISMLNDRIEGLLENPGSAEGDPAALLANLAHFAQKRRQVQEALDRYRTKREKTKTPPLSAFRDLGANDPESLEMTLDLLRERQKALQEEDQRLSIEIDGIQEELSLQRKMKDFLAGIKRLNQDSGAPPESSERTSLSRLYGGKSAERLAGRLVQLKSALLKNRSTREQITQLISQIQEKSNSSKERKTQ